MKKVNRKLELAQCLVNQAKTNEGIIINYSFESPTEGYLVTVQKKEYYLTSEVINDVLNWIIEEGIYFSLAVVDSLFLKSEIIDEMLHIELFMNILSEDLAIINAEHHGLKNIWDIKNKKEIKI